MKVLVTTIKYVTKINCLLNNCSFFGIQTYSFIALPEKHKKNARKGNKIVIINEKKNLKKTKTYLYQSKN